MHEARETAREQKFSLSNSSNFLLARRSPATRARTRTATLSSSYINLRIVLSSTLEETYREFLKNSTFKNRKEVRCMNEQILVIPDAETRAKIAEKIDFKNAVDARPCDCTACGSCRCTPCK